MTKAKRLALWGLVLSPVLLFPTVFISARLWLNHHLKRELAFGGFRLHLENPLLGWDLDFSADSLAITAPRFGLLSGRVETDLRLWNSIASLKPSIALSAERIRIRVDPDSADSLELERRRKRRKTPTFPNVRIPVAFEIKAGRVDFAMGNRKAFEARGVDFYSQGPKGVVLELSGLAIRGQGNDSALSEVEGAYRASARWFGTSLRYQLRAQDSAGNFVKLDGERRKRDLRIGKDSVEASLADISAYAFLFPGKPITGADEDSSEGHRPRRGAPELRNLALQGSMESGDHRTVRLHAAFRSPPVWQIRSQAVELTGNLVDSLGHISLMSKGESEETGYLQGRFELPSLDSGFARAASGLTGSLSGFTRNFRFRIGRRILPGDAEIRRLRILPGLVFEADLRSRDSSVFHGRAYRGPDSGSVRGDSSWKCAFSGTVDPDETWVHAWVDTNVSFRHARVSAQADRKGLKVETWVLQPKAYGSSADSLYALQTVDKSAYHLLASRVSGKEAIWPVTGQVVWGRSLQNQTGKAPAKRPSRRHRQVSLVFRTKHPRFGSAEYAMPGPGRMEVKVENLDGQKLPYVRLAKLLSLHPVATGRFAWDWHARTGSIDAKADLAYNGRPLGMSARAEWDAAAFAAEGLDLTFLESTLRLSGHVRLRGMQFWQMKKLGLADLADLSLSAGNFDAASLSAILGEAYPVDRGMLNGTLTYSDSSGFRGTYSIRDLELRQFRKRIAIPHLFLAGEGESFRLSMRTSSSVYPWLNDSLNLTVADVLGRDHGIALEVRSDDGLTLAFNGHSREFRDVDGRFTLRGKSALLPGQAGEIRDADISGHFTTPFSAPLGKDLLQAMVLDSTSFSGRYAVPGLDTQSFRGSLSLNDGRLRVPDLSASNRGGVTLTGEADCLLSRSPTVTARMKGENLALQWPGIQKLLLSDADASLRLDSTGFTAQATVGRAEFASSRPPVSMRGAVEGLSLEYARPRAPKEQKGTAAAGVIPQLKVKGKLRGFLFKHKIGFRELQKSIKTVKVDKRKKRVKPMDVQINLETAGSENRVETDVLRMVFVGDIAVKGVYPYTLLSGEFSALNGELGQTSQSYDITDFDLKWQNATVEEGRISVEGGKRLRADCKPDTKRTCNVYVKLAGRLDEMAFTYDSDCGGNTGADLEPSALINSVSSGCYSDEYVAGGGGGNYGEAVFALLEPTINEKLSSVGSTFSGGWIKRTSVSGIGTAVSGDTTGTMPLSVAVESKEKWGVSFKASAGYHAEKKVQNPWENKASAEWRPPLEKASGNSEWKRRVRDRVTLEASVETRPEEKVKEENRQVRKQVGIRYRFKFWDLW